MNTRYFKVFGTRYNIRILRIICKNHSYEADNKLKNYFSFVFLDSFFSFVHPSPSSAHLCSLTRPPLSPQRTRGQWDRYAGPRLHLPQTRFLPLASAGIEQKQRNGDWVSKWVGSPGPWGGWVGKILECFMHA